MENVIHEYVRERVTGKGKQIVGVIVGLVDEDGILITGWSKTNLKAGDVFDKTEGIRIAKDRALGIEDSPDLPPQMLKQMRMFQIRCLRYFKQAIFEYAVANTNPVAEVPVEDEPVKVPPVELPPVSVQDENLDSLVEAVCADLGVLEGNANLLAITLPTEVEDFARALSQDFNTMGDRIS